MHDRVLLGLALLLSLVGLAGLAVLLRAMPPPEVAILPAEEEAAVRIRAQVVSVESRPGFLRASVRPMSALSRYLDTKTPLVKGDVYDFEGRTDGRGALRVTRVQPIVPQPDNE